MIRTWAISAVVLVAAMGLAIADTTEADQTFKRAKQLAKQGRWDEACPLYEQSYRSEPAIGALLNVANCHEQLGRTATAWAEFRQAAALARDHGDARARYAEGRAQQLAPRLSRLAVLGSAVTIAGLTVSRDGVDITSQLGTAIPVDPGEHVLAARAPGFDRWQSTVEVGASGTTIEVDLPRLRPIETREPPRRGLRQVRSEPSPPAVVRAPARARKTAALIIGGAGIAAMGVGVVFGLEALQRSSEVDDLCQWSTCDPRAEDLISDGRAASRTADVFLGIGVASVATGVILYVTASKRTPAEQRTVKLVPTANGVAITGAF